MQRGLVGSEMCIRDRNYAKEKTIPHSIMQFVDDLPQIYLTVLIAVKKILQSGMEYANFERIYELYKDLFKRCESLSTQVDRGQLLKIFVDLIEMGLLHSDLSIQSENLQKSKVTLRFRIEEFEQYIAKDTMKISVILKNWSRSPLVLSLIHI
eukprot:TRINITY_DN21932_c0_g1_i2.p1 TRINITY_DN21932_c0_g1~~TRINITY_DN21932_c0_g1_i2.p1  ORF type:complete len:153 (-),score=23.27 TRINITY_DN21932_c0_g1_i2:163-621(-)